MAAKSIFYSFIVLILAAGVSQALVITTAPDATETTAATPRTATSTSTDFSCYINTGLSNTTGALQVMPEPANFTRDDTFCYSAQVPNGTCANGTCASYSWNYGVADKEGCDSFKQQERLGFYQTVLCCATAQCNKPSASVDSTTVVMTNPDVPTISTTSTAANTSTSTVAAGTTSTGGSSSASATTTTTGSTKSGSGAGMTVPGAFVVLCLSAFAIVF